MNTFALWRLFHRPGTRGTAGHTSVLAVVAFAAATTIFLTVLGGVHGFIGRASADHTIGCMINPGPSNCAPGTYEAWSKTLETGNRLMIHGSGHWTAAQSAAVMNTYAGGYVLLAGFACMLLIVPFVALAGSAARLAASRRDARLAALRLAGATTAQVTKLTALDAASQALLGSLIGILGYVAVMPLIMLLNFQNRRFTFEELWVGSLALIAVIAGVAVLALASSLITLRRVAITPLGVMQRTSPPLPTKWRVLIFAVIMAVGYMVLSNLQSFARFGEGTVYAMVFGIIFLCFALVNLVGTWVVTFRAKLRARRPKDAATMIAMRRILDNPKRAWRNVSGVALAVFIAGMTSVCGLVASGINGNVDPLDPSMLYARDISTGGFLTLAFAAVLAAVSSGVMQAGSVYDQVGEYRMLTLEGTDKTTLDKARMMEVITPLNTVVAVSGGCSLLLLFPIMAAALFRPATLMTLVAGIALCYALIAVGAIAANHVARTLNLADYRADD